MRASLARVQSNLLDMSRALSKTSGRNGLAFLLPLHDPPIFTAQVENKASLHEQQRVESSSLNHEIRAFRSPRGHVLEVDSRDFHSALWLENVLTSGAPQMLYILQSTVGIDSRTTLEKGGN